jgi:hypothetical protein
VNSWLYSEHELPKLAESTQGTHQHNFKKFVSPRWGKLTLPEVRVLALNVWFKELGESLAHETLQKLKATFHRVLEYGMENELIPLAENPVAKVNLKGVGREKERPRTPSFPLRLRKQSSTDRILQSERLCWLPYSRLFGPVKSSGSVGKPWIS